MASIKKKRKLFYFVKPKKDYHWCPGIRKWLPIEDALKYNCGSDKCCKTFDQAMKYARKVPNGEVIIEQFRVRKGRRQCRTYYFLRPLEEKLL